MFFVMNKQKQESFALAIRYNLTEKQLLPESWASRISAGLEQSSLVTRNYVRANVMYAVCV